MQVAVGVKGAFERSNSFGCWQSSNRKFPSFDVRTFVNVCRATMVPVATPEDVHVTGILRILQSSDCPGRQFGVQSLEAEKTHYLIASCIEEEAGQLARENYIQRASRRCPHLRTLPKTDDIRQELSLSTSTFCRNQMRNHDEKILVWSLTLQWQIFSEMKATGRVGKATFEAAHLLIKCFDRKTTGFGGNNRFAKRSTNPIS